MNNEFLEKKIVLFKEKSHESEKFLDQLSSIFSALSFEHFRFAAAYISFERKINYIVVRSTKCLSGSIVDQRP